MSREKPHQFLLDDAAMQGFMFFADNDCIGYAYVASTGHVGPLALMLVSNRAFGDWSRYLLRNPGFI